MSRTQTLVALLAVVLASLAALQIPGRILFALAAVLLIATLGLWRLRASLAARRVPPKPHVDAGARAAEIREARDRRLGR